MEKNIVKRTLGNILYKGTIRSDWAAKNRIQQQCPHCGKFMKATTQLDGTILLNCTNDRYCPYFAQTGQEYEEVI